MLRSSKSRLAAAAGPMAVGVMAAGSGDTSRRSTGHDSAPAAASTSGRRRGDADSSPQPHEDDSQWETAGRLLAPWRALTSPVLLGRENLPRVSARHGTRSGLERPVLLVGNHTLFGLYDTPMLLHELYLRGIKARGLAHPGHWKGPVAPVFEAFGAVKAGPLACYRLLQAGEAVLLFPGGAREVTKRRGEEYQLLWKDAPDFVRSE